MGIPRALVRSAASRYNRLIISLSEGKYVLEDFLNRSLTFDVGRVLEMMSFAMDDAD